MKSIARILVIAVVAGVAGCCRVPPAGGPPQAPVVERACPEPPKVKLTTADYGELAGSVTRKMLESSLVRGWKDKTPRLVLAPLRNAMCDGGIRTAEVGQRIADTLLESHAVRLVDEATASFDYVLRSELSPDGPTGSAAQAGVGCRLELQLFAISGEPVGLWSGRLGVADGRKLCD